MILLITRLYLGLGGRDRVCEVLLEALQVYIEVPGPESGSLGSKMAQHRFLRFIYIYIYIYIFIYVYIYIS